MVKVIGILASLALFGCAGAQGFVDSLPDGKGPPFQLDNRTQSSICAVTLVHAGESEKREVALPAPLEPGSQVELALPAKKGQKLYAEAGPDSAVFDVTAYECKNPSTMERGEVIARMDKVAIVKELVVE